MYFGRGFAKNEIGDFNLIVHEGRLHLFHLCLPSQDVVAHLVSDDGLHWEPLPHAIRTGNPGECDDDQIWTMGTFAWQGKYYMLYTALCQADDGLIQRTGLAISGDLIHWEKAPNNPVAAPDARWYEADTSVSGRADWRDPFGWVEGDTIHALVCAHEKDGSHNRRGCVGHFTSRDAIHWQVQSPFYTPRLSSDWEVPTLFKLEEKYYLLGHLCAPLVDVYRVAEKIEGPWRRPLHDWTLPPGCWVFTPVVWHEKTLLFHFIQCDFDWPDPRRMTGRAMCTRAIAPPKEAIALENGDLILRSCRFLWDEMATGASIPSLQDAANAARGGAWKVENELLSARSEVGMGVALWPDEYSDFVLEVSVTLGDACEAGVLWRSDDEANVATLASLVPGRARIELQRVLAGPPEEPRRVGRGFSVLQENHFSAPAGRAVRLRVVAWGPYLEVSADDRVLLCYLSMSRRAGKPGIFVCDGEATFSSPQLQVLPAPPMRKEEIAVPAH